MGFERFAVDVALRRDLLNPSHRFNSVAVSVLCFR